MYKYDVPEIYWGFSIIEIRGMTWHDIADVEDHHDGTGKQWRRLLWFKSDYERVPQVYRTRPSSVSWAIWGRF